MTHPSTTRLTWMAVSLWWVMTGGLAWAQGATAKPQTAATASGAAPAVVKASGTLSNESPTFGDELEIIVTLRYPKDVRVFFPPRPDVRPMLLLPNRPPKTERRQEGQETVDVITIPVLVAKSGLNRTPTIEVPWHRGAGGQGAGDSGTASIPSLRAVVKSQFAADNRVKEAPLPKAMPLMEDNTPLEVGMLIVLMMVIAAALTTWALSLYKRRAARREKKPEAPPHVAALAKLEELEGSERLDSGEPRLLLGEMSGILFDYLGRRYRFPALSMTSTELLEEMERHDLRGASLQEVRDFTEIGDLVRFARQPATPDFMRGQVRWIRGVVVQTMQSSEELEQLRRQRLERLARQRRLRIQVMAPAPLRGFAFSLDLVIGAFVALLVAWTAIDTQRQGLFDAAYGLFFLWLGVRDLLGEASPGKSLTGLRIATWDPEGEEDELDVDAALREAEAARQMSQDASEATLQARLTRNLLFWLPGAGLLAEAITCWKLPEMRRLGDQLAQTRVIDGRYGLRRHLPRWWPSLIVTALALVMLALPLLMLGGRPPA